jgi:hypothetical protein
MVDTLVNLYERILSIFKDREKLRAIMALFSTFLLMKEGQKGV